LGNAVEFIVPFDSAEASASHNKEIERRIHSSAAQLLLGVSPIYLEHYDNLHPAMAMIIIS